MKYEIELEEGKYTYRFDNGKQDALRYGEPWRDLCGDNFIYALAAEVQRNRERKEPWASVCTVATNRALRKFAAASPVKQGTMVAMVAPQGVQSVRVVGLVTGEGINYPLSELGFEPEDLEAP